MNITNLYACIGVPAEREDEYLTFNSMNFHKHIGYDLVGRFKKCGYKFIRWYDMVWMEKIIGQQKAKRTNIFDALGCAYIIYLQDHQRDMKNFGVILSADMICTSVKNE